MASARDRDQASGWFSPDDGPEMIFKVRVADDAEAEQLRMEQAQVLWEVTTWLAQKHSGSGRDRAV